MNRNILIIIGVVIVAAIAFIIYRSNVTQNEQQNNSVDNNNYLATVAPSATASPVITTSVTPSGTITVTPTVTATVTVTPTTVSENFDQDLASNWVYGMITQSFSGKTYFIDSSNPMLLKKGSSASDSSAETVYTSDGGDIGSFNVIGSSIIIALKRNASANESRLIRYYPGTSKTVLLYKYQSSKVEITAFAIPKDSTSEFYIGLNGVDHKYQPMLIYAKQYAQVWIQTLDTAKKEDTIGPIALTSDTKSIKVKVDVASGDDKTVLFTIPTP